MKCPHCKEHVEYLNVFYSATIKYHEMNGLRVDNTEDIEIEDIENKSCPLCKETIIWFADLLPE